MDDAQGALGGGAVAGPGQTGANHKTQDREVNPAGATGLEHKKQDAGQCRDHRPRQEGATDIHF
ncbi:hypothetical protein D3C77_690400 [compost metagenome]